jgi:hypothetical protein
MYNQNCCAKSSQIDNNSDWSGNYNGTFYSTYYSNGTTPTYIQFESPIEIVRQEPDTPSWLIYLALPGYPSTDPLIAISSYNAEGLSSLDFVSGTLPFSGVALATKTDCQNKVLRGTVNGIIQVSGQYPPTVSFVEFQRV